MQLSVRCNLAKRWQTKRERCCRERQTGSTGLCGGVAQRKTQCGTKKLFRVQGRGLGSGGPSVSSSAGEGDLRPLNRLEDTDRPRPQPEDDRGETARDLDDSRALFLGCGLGFWLQTARQAHTDDLFCCTASRLATPCLRFADIVFVHETSIAHQTSPIPYASSPLPVLFLPFASPIVIGFSHWSPLLNEVVEAQVALAVAHNHLSSISNSHVQSACKMCNFPRRVHSS